MKNILVTGANGQLGQAIKHTASKYPSFNLLYTDIDTLDICNKDAISSYLEKNFIHTIINTAAYTAVNQAEGEESKAYRINSEAVQNLAQSAGETGCKVIHISTDYVFDGKNCIPYKETDATHPESVYGRTKLAGEVILQSTWQESIIIRTSWLYSEYGNNFVNTMLKLGKEKRELPVVFDQVGTPTYAGDLAEVLFAILKQEEKDIFLPGIYHFSNEGVCSWYDFARKIMELAGLYCNVYPIETKDYPTPAPRPSYSVLNKAKIKEAYNITIPHWEMSLKAMINN